jgi:hypothetical protein
MELAEAKAGAVNELSGVFVGTLEGARHLLIGKPVELAQDERLAIRSGEAGERLAHAAARFLTLHFPLERPARCGRLIHGKWFFQVDDPPRASVVIHRKVAGDPVDPRLEVVGRPKLADPLMRPDEGILDNILRRRHVIHKVVDISEDGAVKPLEELRECRPVTLLGTADQVDVGLGRSAHVRSVGSCIGRTAREAGM